MANPIEPKGGTIDSKKFSIDQNKIISRIEACDNNDYYGIINVTVNRNEGKRSKHQLLDSLDPASAINSRYRSICLYIHPDKTDFEGAQNARNKLNVAYDTLKDGEKRKRYNGKRKNYPHDETIDHEGFHHSAAGSDPLTEDLPPPDPELTAFVPTDKHKAIFEEATPFVLMVIKSAAVDKDTKISLDALNKRITVINSEVGLSGADLKRFTINYDNYKLHMSLVQSSVTELHKDPNNLKARQAVENTNALFHEEIRRNGYPESWVLVVPEKKVATKVGEVVVQPVPTPEDAFQPVPTPEDAFQPVTTPEVAVQPVQTPAEFMAKMGAVPPSGDGTGLTSSGRSGFTLRGDRILGCIGLTPRARFVVEKLGQTNPVALVNNRQIGIETAKKYLKLDEKNNLKDPISLQEGQLYQSVIGFASNPVRTKTVGSSFSYGPGYALVRTGIFEGNKAVFKDIVMSRGDLRLILGDYEADSEIAQFYQNVQITPPWNIAPMFFREPNTPMLGWHGSDSDYSDSENHMTSQQPYSDNKHGRGRTPKHQQSRYNRKQQDSTHKKDMDTLSDRLDKMMKMIEAIANQ